MTKFGRTPAAQGNDGRDHHPHAFSIWMAGGGVRGGTIYGKTDDLGIEPTQYITTHIKFSFSDLKKTFEIVSDFENCYKCRDEKNEIT